MVQNDFRDAVERYEKQYPTASFTHAGQTLLFGAPNKQCLFRAETLLTKEPDTIAWLDSIPAGAVFLDVGANVGMYTIYAAAIRDARVFAFEPESQNYAILHRNLLLNRIADKVVAWCAALSDEARFDRIHLSNFVTGGSCHAFGEALGPHLQPGSFPFTQGACATTVDHLVASGAMPAPQFVKIDVDGFEHKVIAGAARTLAGPAVQSLIVELNSALPEHLGVIETLAAHGFRHDPAQAERAKRKDGYFAGVGEYVFRR